MKPWMFKTKMRQRYYCSLLGVYIGILMSEWFCFSYIKMVLTTLWTLKEYWKPFECTTLQKLRNQYFLFPCWIQSMDRTNGEKRKKKFKQTMSLFGKKIWKKLLLTTSSMFQLVIYRIKCAEQCRYISL